MGPQKGTAYNLLHETAILEPVTTQVPYHVEVCGFEQSDISGNPLSTETKTITQDAGAALSDLTIDHISSRREIGQASFESI